MNECMQMKQREKRERERERTNKLGEVAVTKARIGNNKNAASDTSQANHIETRCL